ncbi:MAG TPA: holo-ACP synthase [Mycobacteriales bacterium]|nr:holo-ACP synthase [Mycobacteriales bacterium]
MTIVGVGVDIVDLARFATALDRTPHLSDRLFTRRERNAPPSSLAATFAAKEAVAKVLGAPGGLAWHDVEVRRDPTGRPLLDVRDTVQAAADELGITGWHLSLSHDAGVVVAMVVAEHAP